MADGPAENGELPVFFADYQLKPVLHQMPPPPLLGGTQ